MRLSRFLDEDEIKLYRRHIDDGMSFEDLAPEFNTSADRLFVYFRFIEEKLRQGFDRENKK